MAQGRLVTGYERIWYGPMYYDREHWLGTTSFYDVSEAERMTHAANSPYCRCEPRYELRADGKVHVIHRRRQ